MNEFKLELKDIKLKEDISMSTIGGVISGIFENLETLSYDYMYREPIISLVEMIVFLDNDKLSELIETENVLDLYDLYIEYNLHDVILQYGEKVEEKFNYIYKVCEEKYNVGCVEASALKYRVKEIDYSNAVFGNDAALV